MMKYFIKTYGCQMNHSDSERIVGVLELANYEKSTQEYNTDLIVINMCSVRESAVSRIAGNFKKYKKYKKTNPNFKTVITGCILESDKAKFGKLFDLVINIKEIEKLPERLKNCRSRLARYDKNQEHQKNINDYFSINPQRQSKITAYVPIMTGCNNFCSYCVVPYTRGREKSRSAEEVLNEVAELVKKGYKEIILLGQNVNSYKASTKYPVSSIKGNLKSDKNVILSLSKNSSKNKPINFPSLLQFINDIPGNFWIRFLTSHPKDITEELIKTVARCEKCTECVHLALQSGDDDILEKMNRKYTEKHFLNLAKMIRKYIPNVAITTDIIVGFPTETKKQFKNTARSMKTVKFDMAYINKYSPRTGTVSAKMIDSVSWDEKKKRENVLNAILEETALENNQKYIGKTIDVLIEKVEKNNAYGKTRSFKNVKITTCHTEHLIGKFKKIKITQANAWGLEGKIV